MQKEKQLNKQVQLNAELKRIEGEVRHNMKRRSMSIYITIGLAGVFIASFFVEIEPQVIVGLSIATLLFTLAQMLDSQVSFWNEDLQNQVDICNSIGNFNLTPENIFLTKAMFRYMDQPKRQKIMQILATVLYCISFVILFIVFVVPLNISERTGTSVTILSSALLFFSIWIVDKQQERKAQWNEVEMIALITKNVTVQADSQIIMEAQNGETENGNP